MRQATSLRLLRADYHDPVHMTALVDLLDAYARDSAGGAEPLSDYTKANLPTALQARPNMFSVLAFDDAQAVCRWVWSTVSRAFPRLPAVLW
jgi:hypothetical protein